MTTFSFLVIVILLSRISRNSAEERAERRAKEKHEKFLASLSRKIKNDYEKNKERYYKKWLEEAYKHQ